MLKEMKADVVELIESLSDNKALNILVQQATMFTGATVMAV